MKIKLVEKKDEASGTKSFFWEPEMEVKWQAGQYFYFTLPEMKYPDARGNTRHFTISASPTEGKLIRLTTRVRQESGYKKTLDELPIGAVIEGEGPNGNFILDEKSKGSNVFIAGGIGITPFRSMIKNEIDKNLQLPIHLIYSNSLPEEVAFKDELLGWTKDHPFLKVDMTVSHLDQSKEQWAGLTGRIDEAMIKKLVYDTENPTWWVAGPPGMIDAMEEVLGKMGITSDKIRSEKFTGY